MARTKEINIDPCDVCGKVIRYKADVARHMQRHSSATVMHQCPFDGCPYQALQKSNLNTHIRTHTGEKPNACPDCDFRTADPGCLTRHRRRKHGYIPRGKAATKQSRRHSPYYKRNDETSSASSSSSTESLQDDLDSFLAANFFIMGASSCKPDPNHEESQKMFSCTGDKASLSLDMALPSFPLDISEAFSFEVSPALGTCSQLYHGINMSFDPMASYPVQQQSEMPSGNTPFGWGFDAAFQHPSPQPSPFPVYLSASQDSLYFSDSQIPSSLYQFIS